VEAIKYIISRGGELGVPACWTVHPDPTEVPTKKVNT